MPRLKYSRSNYKTCWDEKENNNITSLERLIKDQFKSNYEQKHEILLNKNETDFLNSIEIKCCPRCGSIHIIRHGFNRNKTHRYYCKDCKKHFSPTTNTLFENHKIKIPNMIEFFINIFHFQSIASASRNNKISYSTGLYRTKKLFLALKEFQENIIFKNRIYADILFRKTKYNNKLARYSIVTAFDGYIFLSKIIPSSNPSQIEIQNSLEKHIKRDSTLVHTTKKCFKKLIDKLNLENIVFRKNKKPEKGQNTSKVMEPLNNKIRFLRLFLNKHSSLKRSNLQDYLNLYSFIQNGPNNVLKKVENIFLMFTKPRLSLKFSN